MVLQTQGNGDTELNIPSAFPGHVGGRVSGQKTNNVTMQRKMLINAIPPEFIFTITSNYGKKIDGYNFSSLKTWMRKNTMIYIKKETENAIKNPS